MALALDRLTERVRTHLLESAEVQRRAAVECGESIIGAARLIAGAIRSGGKVLLCGNGGSAADCQHMAAELVSRLTAEFERPALPAVALTTDSSFLTAFANDYGFDGLFERQVEALGKPGDVLVAISTSGNSANVLRAVLAAQRAGMGTVALTGRDGGGLAGLATVAIRIPSPDTQHIQEAHLAVEHVVCGLIERELFDGKPRSGSSAL